MKQNIQKVILTFFLTFQLKRRHLHLMSKLEYPFTFNPQLILLSLLGQCCISTLTETTTAGANDSSNNNQVAIGFFVISK